MAHQARGGVRPHCKVIFEYGSSLKVTYMKGFNKLPLLIRKQCFFKLLCLTAYTHFTTEFSVAL